MRLNEGISARIGFANVSVSSLMFLYSRLLGLDYTFLGFRPALRARACLLCMCLTMTGRLSEQLCEGKGIQV